MISRMPNACRVLPALLLPVLLAGCNPAPHPMSKEDREAFGDCKQEADRKFAARNRYLLSEGGDNSAPFSGNGLAYDPNKGLADEYEEQRYLDSCMARSAAGPAMVPGTAPSNATKP